MAEIVRMPKLSDTMVEGVVAEWHKKVGDTVSEGDLLAEIETDKATMEFESFYDGVLLHIGVEKGDAAPVNSVLAVIGEKGEDFKALLSEAESAAPAEEKKEEAPKPKVEEKKVEATSVAQPVATESTESISVETSDGGRIFVSPLAKKMAEERNINLSMVKGTGDNGRIVKRDIENYVPSASAPVFSAPVGTESYSEEPFSQMRKAISRTLSASKFSAPHFYLKMEVNMDNAIKARKAINASGDVKISFNDMIVKAVAQALRKHPKVNVDYIDDTIRYNNHIHIGVAVAVPDGLVVPVIKFADSKGFAQIGTEVKDMASKAKSKKLKPEDMQGGTFAISNLGMYGIEDFTSIINPPNGGILSVGAIKETAVVKNGELVPGNVMKLSLSCDHRVIDGATGSEFLQTLKSYLENPVMMMI
ncbi:MAG: pyruvate dehydrogenase complex dihydrolipoamide acetyltransferase [Putridiphycobacter sp.]